MEGKRGHVYRSVTYLAERWGWSRKKVTSFLKLLRDDGMVEFNDEGIQKLIDLFGDNVTDMLDRLDAIQKTGSSYQSFSGKSDDMKGSVKFILKTGEIKEDD